MLTRKQGAIELAKLGIKFRYRESYGGADGRSINRHTTRVYEDSNGMILNLSKCHDACPPYFEIYGPYAETYRGILPRFKVQGKELWGDGYTWGQAIEVFIKCLKGEITEEEVSPC